MVNQQAIWQPLVLLLSIITLPASPAALPNLPSSLFNTTPPTLHPRTNPPVDLALYAQEGMRLNGLLWATQAQAQTQYNILYPHHTPPNLEKSCTLDQISAHWIRHDTVPPGWEEDFARPDFQRFYQQICPAAYHNDASHVHVTYSDGRKSGSSRQGASSHTGASYTFLLNPPANILTIQDALSPTARLNSGVRLPVGAEIFEPSHLSDIVFAEDNRQHAYYAWQQHWHVFEPDAGVWRAGLRGLRMVILPEVRSPEVIAIVEQCLVMRKKDPTLSQFPGEEFKVGEYCHSALLGTKPNKSLAWLLATHKDPASGFGRKMIASVQVFTIVTGMHQPRWPTFLWYIVDWTAEAEQEARGREADVPTP